MRRKSEEYLRESGIMGEDERFILSFPLHFPKTVKSMDERVARYVRKLSLFVIGIGLIWFFFHYVMETNFFKYLTWEHLKEVFAPGNLGNLLADEDLNLKGLIIALLGVCLLVLSMIYIRFTHIRCHHFLTSKRVYFNSNIFLKSYTHMNIEDLGEVEIQVQGYYGKLFDNYFLYFVAYNFEDMRIGVTKSFAKKDHLYESFPNPDLIHRYRLPERNIPRRRT